MSCLVFISRSSDLIQYGGIVTKANTLRVSLRGSLAIIDILLYRPTRLMFTWCGDAVTAAAVTRDETTSRPAHTHTCTCGRESSMIDFASCSSRTQHVRLLKRRPPAGRPTGTRRVDRPGRDELVTTSIGLATCRRDACGPLFYCTCSAQQRLHKLTPSDNLSVKSI